MRKPAIVAAERQRAEAARYARATCALEGMNQTPIGATLCKKFVEGSISIDDAISEARSHYGLNR